MPQTNSDHSEQLHLIQWLRRIKLDWDLSPDQLSRLSHTPVSVLEKMFACSDGEIEALPSIPAGLDQAVALVGVYRRVAEVYLTPDAQNEWLKKENSVFEGNRPVDVMAMSADHLAYVSYIVESGLRGV